MFNMEPVTKEEQESLEAICQTNGWLKRGGFDWQDDPYLEEYPYEFDRCFTLDDLSDFFQQGNWAIRQGVVYGDLAFIQQVNGGDEWWTLKQDDDGSWVPFESISFKQIAKDMSELTRYVAGMRLATVDECKHLDYLPEESSLVWCGNAFPHLDCGQVRALNNDFQIVVTLSPIGKDLYVSGPSEEFMPDHDQEGMTLLQVINSQIKAASAYEALKPVQTLSERAQGAREAVENQLKTDRANTDRPVAR